MTSYNFINYFIIFLTFNSCIIEQNTDEVYLIGKWKSPDYVIKEKVIWEFNDNGIVYSYNSNPPNKYYYSVVYDCPLECKKYKSKWKIEKYLYLTDISDSNRVLCFEIIFEDNGDVSLRDLHTERDTYGILKRARD